jgi:chromosome segregation ATPase
MMDSKQIENRLKWFDEQRLKDSEVLHGIKEALDEFEKTLQSQAKQIETLSEETSRVAALASRIHQMDEALEKHRKEVSRQLEAAATRRSEKEKHQAALHKTDQEAVIKRIDNLRTELERLDQIDQALENRREEQTRLNKEQNSISTNLEKAQSELHEMQIKIKSIEDLQQKDRKKLGQQEGEVAEFRRKIESTRRDIEAVGDDVRRIDVKTTELVSGEEERREGQAVFFDRQELKLVEFEKQWSEWEGRFEEFELSANEMSAKLTAYDETFRATKQLREALDGLMERIERRITEVSEMQRLADERVKQEWNSFQADENKRWSTFKLTNDEQWRDHEHIHSRLSDQQAEANRQINSAGQALSELQEMDAKRVRELVALIREWASTLDQKKR